jgi:hypothetical protein
MITESTIIISKPSNTCINVPMLINILARKYRLSKKKLIAQTTKATVTPLACKHSEYRSTLPKVKSLNGINAVSMASQATYLFLINLSANCSSPSTSITVTKNCNRKQTNSR